MNPQYIVAHHSLTKDGTVADCEAIRRYHKETNGWSDVGYHHGIERVGNCILSQVERPESADARGAGGRAQLPDKGASDVIGEYNLHIAYLKELLKR